MLAFTLFSIGTALKAALVALGGLVWLAVRFFKKRDAHEPQRTLDQARADSASGADDRLNADLDAAADRLRDPGAGDQH